MAQQIDCAYLSEQIGESDPAERAWDTLARKFDIIEVCTGTEIVNTSS